MSWPKGVSRKLFNKTGKLTNDEPKDTTMPEQKAETAPVQDEVADLQAEKQVETELPKDTPAAEKNTIEIDRGFLKKLMDEMHALTLRVEDAEKVAKKGKGIETSAQRLLNKPMAQEPDPLKVQESIQVVDMPTTMDAQMLHDACPFCQKFHKGQKTILDKTDGNKFACRRCGKHWWKWALVESEMSGEKYPYSLALEQGDKERVERQERIKMSREGLAVGVIEGEDI